MYTSAIRRHLKANLKDRYTLHTHIVSYRKVPFYEDKEKKRREQITNLAFKKKTQVFITRSFKF